MSDPSSFDDADDPYRAIRIGDPGPSSESTKWGQLLTRFMRIVALFWLLQGLMLWHFLLASEKSVFDVLAQGSAFAIIFFAVLDIVAGVGLWLATPCGGVLWLLIASAQIFVTVSIPGIFAGGLWLVAIDVALIAVYFLLTFEAGRDVDAQRIRERRLRRKGGKTAPPRSLLDKAKAAFRSRPNP